EEHQAEIAPGGARRVWAEPETGGESYIPLAPSKRTRSLDIWRQTGKLLDAPEAEYFAAGGFSSVAAVPRPPSTAPFAHPISTAADAAMQKGFDEVRTWLAANLEPTSSGGSSTGLLPNMAAARQYAMDTYGIRNVGGLANRNIAGTNVKSDHAMGKAIDIMTTNVGLGWQIANDFAFGEAHRRFGIENTIWQQSISSRGGPFKGMADRGSATQNHRDHIHADSFDRGGLAAGVGYLAKDTIAPERVLDPRQTVAFEDWMRSPASMPGYGSAASGGSFAGAAGPVNVTVEARVFVGDREITDIVRIESRAVVDGRLDDVDRHRRRK
ncbi:MAG: hypothetical protein JWL64_1546, partial [Frankiales bacterium]|nr:hypothetical protein [Frankiales bacterium]